MAMSRQQVRLDVVEELWENERNERRNRGGTVMVRGCGGLNLVEWVGA
jgi:hypothetical protein